MKTGEGKQRPNILLIMTDQFVAALSGAYGHPVVKTPNLNRLAAQGVRFDAAYTSCPICAPARASLMTGKYVSNIGVYDNAAPLSCDEPAVTHYLSNAGYDTVASGKLHYIGPDQLHGFRRRLTTNIYPSDFEWTTARETKGKPMFEGVSHALAYTAPSVGVRAWSTFLDYDEETHLRALEYLRSRRVGEDAPGSDDERPFFLCVSYHHPHEPFLVTQELWDLYEGEPIDVPEFPPNLEETYSQADRWLNAFHAVDQAELLRDPASIAHVRRSYYGLITYVDRKVGELMQTLEQAGLQEETIVIFVSDHGDMLCERGMVQKRTFYEWSARVPLIVQFPDGRATGTVVEPVSLVDLAPSMLDWAGVPAEERLPMDGRSLAGLLGGSDTDERVAFSEIHSEGVYAPCFMARKGSTKYIHIHGEDAQLFDLDHDPGEWKNLVGDPAYADIENELRAHILERFDPEAIELDVRKSLRQRRLIREAMAINDTHWDYAPPFDATQQYVRRSNTAKVTKLD
jgi:choline-sulfatase